MIGIAPCFVALKRCSGCGHLVGKMSLNVREWRYPACGLIRERNVNAALNFLIVGLAGLALVNGIKLVCIWVLSGCSH
ncbi:zinc ribbon domain-containing protein [Nitrosomonas cryotolerans]|uniref:zinc ribbon domain-containing protein n=1 Tax=Nitrosomonas cryotolerans TaxID=44575 RepID=UPI000940D6E3